MKTITMSVAVIALLFAYSQGYAAKIAEVIKITDPSWVINISQDKKVNIFKFKDGAATCYVIPGMQENSISCIK